MDIRHLQADAHFKDQLKQFVDTTKASIESIIEAIKFLSLGINYRRYTKFNLLTPRAMIPQGIKSARTLKPQRTTLPSKEDVQFCIDFVIESAINLQEFDYNLRWQRF